MSLMPEAIILSYFMSRGGEYACDEMEFWKKVSP